MYNKHLRLRYGLILSLESTAKPAPSPSLLVSVNRTTIDPITKSQEQNHPKLLLFFFFFLNSYVLLVLPPKPLTGLHLLLQDLLPANVSSGPVCSLL